MTPPARASAKWLYAFLLFQFACQAALIAPLGSARTPARVASFASSLALLAVLPAGGRRHPVAPLVYAVIGLPVLGLLHPGLNTPLAGLAQIGLTAAVWAPLLWGTRIDLPPAAFRAVVLLLWGFHTLSSVVGVLQVYDPGTFAPDPEFVKQLYGGALADGLKIRLDDGSRVWRPMGLTDSPGGAAGSGQFAVLAGLVLAVGERSWLLRGAGLVGAVAGMFCIYLCQIRTAVVLTGLGVVLFVALQLVRGRVGRAAGIAGVAGAVVAGGFAWAAAVGGEAMTARLATLTEDRADQVYYANRGIFLEEALTSLPDYPLGAGLGRYGMMNAYFGDPANPDSPPLWAEIQVSAWVYDGGLPLLLAGYAAVGGLCWVTFRAAAGARDDRAAEYAILVAALNLGLVAGTFTYAVFLSSTGMMYLTLNAALFAATAGRPAR